MTETQEQLDQRSRTVFLGNLHADVSRPELRELCQDLGYDPGDVERVEVVPPKEDGGRSCAFCRFVTVEHAQVAITALNGAYFKGLEMRAERPRRSGGGGSTSSAAVPASTEAVRKASGVWRDASDAARPSSSSSWVASSAMTGDRPHEVQRRSTTRTKATDPVARAGAGGITSIRPSPPPSGRVTAGRAAPSVITLVCPGSASRSSRVLVRLVG